MRSTDFRNFEISGWISTTIVKPNIYIAYHMSFSQFDDEYVFLFIRKMSQSIYPQQSVPQQYSAVPQQTYQTPEMITAEQANAYRLQLQYFTQQTRLANAARGRGARGPTAYNPLNGRLLIYMFNTANQPVTLALLLKEFVAMVKNPQTIDVEKKSSRSVGKDGVESVKKSVENRNLFVSKLASNIEFLFFPDVCICVENRIDIFNSFVYGTPTPISQTECDKKNSIWFKVLNGIRKDIHKTRGSELGNTYNIISKTAFQQVKEKMCWPNQYNPIYICDSTHPWHDMTLSGVTDTDVCKEYTNVDPIVNTVVAYRYQCKANTGFEAVVFSRGHDVSELAVKGLVYNSRLYAKKLIKERDIKALHEYTEKSVPVMKFFDYVETFYNIGIEDLKNKEAKKASIATAHEVWMKKIEDARSGDMSHGYILRINLISKHVLHPITLDPKVEKVDPFIGQCNPSYALGQGGKSQYTRVSFILEKIYPEFYQQLSVEWLQLLEMTVLGGLKKPKYDHIVSNTYPVVRIFNNDLSRIPEHSDRLMFFVMYNLCAELGLMFASALFDQCRRESSTFDYEIQRYASLVKDKKDLPPINNIIAVLDTRNDITTTNSTGAFIPSQVNNVVGNIFNRMTLKNLGNVDVNLSATRTIRPPPMSTVVAQTPGVDQFALTPELKARQQAQKMQQQMMQQNRQNLQFNKEPVTPRESAQPQQQAPATGLQFKRSPSGSRQPSPAGLQFNRSPPGSNQPSPVNPVVMAPLPDIGATHQAQPSQPSQLQFQKSPVKFGSNTPMQTPRSLPGSRRNSQVSARSEDVYENMDF